MAIIFDTHAHLNFTAFNNDREEIIRKCLDNELPRRRAAGYPCGRVLSADVSSPQSGEVFMFRNKTWMINVGTNYETSRKAIEIAGKYEEGVYASVGLHPMSLDTGLMKMRIDDNEGSNFEKDFDYKKYSVLAESPKVVAIGEVGLDYYWKPKTKKKLEEFKKRQRTVLCQQLELAKELELPVIFHCRFAFVDLLKMLRETPFGNVPGVIHCFSGGWEEAQAFINMGFYIGFNGIIFKLDLEEVIKNIPPDHILVETDCPYLTPPSFPEERNNPLGVKYVLDKIAKIRNTRIEKLAEITTNNAKSLFKI